jgi:hypothetical protein
VPTFVFEGGFTQLIDRIRAVAERVARSYNLEIFDVQFRREPVGWMLRVFVDVPFDSGAPWPDEAERRRRADASPTIQGSRTGQPRFERSSGRRRNDRS